MEAPVTIEAMACQTKIAKAIVGLGGDYLLSVKRNQGKFRKAIESAFSTQRANKAYGILVRRVWYCSRW